MSRPDPVPLELAEISTSGGVALFPPDRFLPVVVLARVHLHTETVVGNLIAFSPEPCSHRLPSVDVVKWKGVPGRLPEFATVKKIDSVRVLGDYRLSCSSVIGGLTAHGEVVKLLGRSAYQSAEPDLSALSDCHPAGREFDKNGSTFQPVDNGEICL